MQTTNVWIQKVAGFRFDKRYRNSLMPEGSISKIRVSRYVDRGMLPNNFPDAGGTPEYNTVDTALWYFEAVRQYFEAIHDTETIMRLFPALSNIIEAHIKGTRYNIHADASDGLLYAGEAGVQRWTIYSASVGLLF
jgi:predicted glycogen debranching enzyme